MNQIQTLIDSIRDAPHDAVIVAGMFALPVLIVLWIVNRMRHPERGLLNALVIASVGFVLVPWVSSAVLILWVRTGGDSMQASFVGMFLFVAGFWGFRRWLRSAPRAAKPTKALVAPVAHAAPPSALTGEVAELRAEVARLRAERQDRGGEDVAEISHPHARPLSFPFHNARRSLMRAAHRLGPENPDTTHWLGNAEPCLTWTWLARRKKP